MATLQKIRNRAGVLIAIVIGGALIAFIAGDALKSSGSFLASSRNELAEIGGESISIRDFQKKVNQTIEINKIISGQSALSSEQLDQLREQVWQEMVHEYVMNKEYEELGVAITPDELFDLVQGQNMDPMIRQLFQGANRQQIIATLKNLIEAPDGTPNKTYWLNIEKELKKKRVITKYNDLIKKGMHVPAAYAKNISENSSNTVDFSYIVKDYSSISDSTTEITDSEIKSYYNENKDKFKQGESRKIEYIVFEVNPSTEDYKYAEKWISDLKADFSSTENNVQFVELNADTKFDDKFYKNEEIENKRINDFMFSAKKNDIIGTYFEIETYKLAKLNDVKMLPDSVKARHILIPVTGKDIKTAQNKADSLKKLITKGANFADLAKNFSADQNSAVNGGDLGWFVPNKMVKAFDDVAFNSKANQINLVTTQYGIHILQVTKRSKLVKKVQMAIVDRKVEPSQKTFQKAYAEARKFAGENQDSEAFNKSIEEKNLSKRVANLRNNTPNVSGLENSRELIRAAYNTDDTEKILYNSDRSAIFEFGNKFVIAILTEVKEEGSAPVEDVKNMIVRKLRKDKKAEIIEKQLANSITGSQSLLSVAQKENLGVKNATNINFRSFQIPDAGIEPNVIAASVILEKGQISKPIKGNSGVYVILVSNITKHEVNDQSIKNSKIRLEQQFQSQIYRQNQIFRVLKENAEVIDKRYKFY